MQPTRDLALVLRSVAFEDRHRVVTAISKDHGIITALARNSVHSRRFGGTLEPFVVSEWMFSKRPGAEMFSLTEAHFRKSFEGLQKDFEKLAMASFFSEVLLKIAPHGEPGEELFRLQFHSLSLLDELPGASIAMLNFYLGKLLQWSGNQPILSSCLQCGVNVGDLELKSELSCVIPDAGWICPQCRNSEVRHIRDRRGQSFQQASLRVHPASVADLQLGLTFPIREAYSKSMASEDEHRRLFQFLEALYIYHIPGFDKKSLKTLRFLGLKTNIPEGMVSQ